MSLFGPVPDAVDELVCSAAAAAPTPTWGLLWNNPKLHTPERRKVWLACDDHREHLSQFLDVRGLPAGRRSPSAELDGPPARS